ncbi:Fap amyloid fibril minor component [Methylophaga thiooxydans]|uniref:Uncharacterized protein n=2 Tax=Methylophaga thiooxydans TaxID=392484 RepID=C0N2E2_9GAMM|nr:hypothetical protein [Methylophaga thiooxydans]EEF81056.1 hypothetical protein MDMS009_376 [Methylophaga thiooxydans DMS010]KGM07784.1 Fap amyloid fibril minor component [Methylophaga thiooxydans]
MKLLPISLLFASLLPTLPAAIADDALTGLPYAINNSMIDGHALSGTRGRNVVNMAAGDANAQQNAAAIALNPNGVASIGLFTQQNLHQNSSTPSGLSISGIGGHAFTNSIGALSINQTSGTGNAQVNGMAIGIGLDVNVMSESMLSNMSTGAGLAAREPDEGIRSATIADSAFNGSRGLVQVNQSAGSGNSTANNFVLQLDLGAK